jgi:glycosyltransferase involved in cell wall biosynthesis
VPVACSVVVPAHDEAAVIADRLHGLLDSLPPGVVDLVVVANGCTDDTAAAAGRVPGVRVVEIPEASKTAALNRGDRETTAFPRVYLDADIRLSGDALLQVASALRTDRAVVAAPRVRFDLSACSWAVRAFFSVFQRLPYAGEGLVGLGVFGLSEAGRRRFDVFPDVVADDLFVQRLFVPEERCTVDASFEVVAPRRLQDLLAVRTRVARGNRQLADRGADLGVDATGTTSATAVALLRVVAWRPHLLPGALVYVAVTLLARSRARRAVAGVRWERDASSRSPAVGLRAPEQGERS